MSNKELEPLNSDITFTSAQCNLGDGWAQSFLSTVVHDPGPPASIRANATGKSIKDGSDYNTVNQVTLHWPKLRQRFKVFGAETQRARLMTPERKYGEYIARVSDGLSLNLGSGVTLHDL
jgi:hypothetical protein